MNAKYQLTRKTLRKLVLKNDTNIISFPIDICETL